MNPNSIKENDLFKITGKESGDTHLVVLKNLRPDFAEFATRESFYNGPFFRFNFKPEDQLEEGEDPVLESDEFTIEQVVDIAGSSDEGAEDGPKDVADDAAEKEAAANAPVDAPVPTDADTANVDAPADVPADVPADAPVDANAPVGDTAGVQTPAPTDAPAA